MSHIMARAILIEPAGASCAVTVQWVSVPGDGIQHTITIPHNTGTPDVQVRLQARTAIQADAAAKGISATLSEIELWGMV